LNIEARSNIAFSLVLTIVAFSYPVSEDIPKIPNATTLKMFINSRFVTVLAVGLTTFYFSWLTLPSNDPYIDAKAAITLHTSILFSETVIVWAAFAMWAFGNCTYLDGIFWRIEMAKRAIAEDEQLGWLKYKTEERKFSAAGARAPGCASAKASRG
jgi:hypothetical protein